jgi:hypothetical protein
MPAAPFATSMALKVLGAACSFINRSVGIELAPLSGMYLPSCAVGDIGSNPLIRSV